MERHFYIYVLFDSDAIPRWVGKGQGSRFASTIRIERRNHMKNAFIRHTLNALGDIPRVKIRTNLTEAEAFEIEHALIKAIGRRCKKTGPLLNIADGGGPTSASSRHIHDSMTPMDKWLWRKAISDGHMRRSPEERSEQGRRREADRGKDARMATGRKTSATMLRTTTAEQRREAALKASLQVTRTRWINDGTANRRINDDDPIPAGWIAGRINQSVITITALKTAATGSRWITDGYTTKRLKNGKPPPPGWTYGRPKIARSMATH